MRPSSNALEALIQQKIIAEGPISFADFMALALYHSELGYYNAVKFNLGKHGDFTTAPEISPLFATCFAEQCLQLADLIGTHTILELGAGTGRFAKDLLLTLDAKNQLPTHYYIYEISHRLRTKQQTLLAANCPHLLSRVVWLDHLPEELRGILIANEVLDALPVHCFHIDENIKERRVAYTDDRFTWHLTTPTQPFAERVQQLKMQYGLASGYESEINLGLPSFIQSLAERLKQGVMLWVDYGYGQKEYYRPERRHGTLTCFYQHQHHDNPFMHIGEQDITAHVDFTQVIESAAQAGCDLLGYTSQAAFLLGCGLTNLVHAKEQELPPHEIFKLHQAIKLLTLPTEMGERIKVMGLSKNININNKMKLDGFQLYDARREL